MAWLFWFRSKGRAKHMIAILMAIIALQYIKDLFFIDLCYTSPSCFISNFLTASDFVAVPFYGYILVELCRPGSLKLRHIVLSLSPFILLPILYAATHLHWIFTILIALSTLYGIACAGWMVRELPRYHPPAQGRIFLRRQHQPSLATRSHHLILHHSAFLGVVVFCAFHV